MPDSYWIIEYQMNLLSDFHAGAGITLLGGNLHGLRLDQDGYPYLPHTQVRGLLRWGGLRLTHWHTRFTSLFKRNFEARHRNTGIFWSYTRASFPVSVARGRRDFLDVELFMEQSHVNLERGIVKHLFAYQKAGAVTADWTLSGRIFSVEPATEVDVAFLIAAMRAEDRIGQRRSRGYGKVNWQPLRVCSYQAGKSPTPVAKNLENWLEVAFQGVSP